MLEKIKNLFTANKEKEEDIVKTMSDVYNERIKIYEAWKSALNQLIDENRCEDGYAYIYLPSRNSYVRAEYAEVYITPLVSGGITKSLSTKAHINGLSFCLTQSDTRYLFNDKKNIRITEEVVIVDSSEYYEKFKKARDIVKTMPIMDSGLFNVITKYLEMFSEGFSY